MKTYKYLVLFAAIVFFSLLSVFTPVSAQTNGCQTMPNGSVYCPTPTQPAATAVPYNQPANQPTGSGFVAPGNCAGHTVQAGQTLGAIASMYGTTVGQLQQLNGITNRNLIQVGQCLVVSSGGIVMVPVEGSDPDLNTIINALTPTTTPMPQGQSIGEQAHLSFTYECGFSAYVYPRLTGVWPYAVTSMNLSVTAGGSSWNMPTAYQFQSSVFVPLYFDQVSLIVSFSDGSHITTSALVSDCDNGGHEYVPPTSPPPTATPVVVTVQVVCTPLPNGGTYCH